MANYRTVNIKQKVYEQLEEDIEKLPYESVKDLMLQGARNEVNREAMKKEIAERVRKEMEKED